MDSSAIWIVIALPILGFLVQSLGGGLIVKAVGEAKSKSILGFLAVAPIALAFIIGAMITTKVGAGPATVVTGPSWIQIAGFSIPFEWIVDPLSMTMVLIITGIGSLIHLYATGYMAKEKDYARFFTYLNLFIAAMLILVLGNNLALLFMGWEGVGLCSYLLIGFWYKDTANARAANKAFIVNRIGDWGLVLGLFLIVCVVLDVVPKETRLLSYDVILPALKTALVAKPALATSIGLLLFVGAAGKSAQFPLYVWLPDAMAGPTPVSALIHAATMVTSGVVLLNRMHVVFECSPVASVVVACVGAFTALYGALIAFGQTDIKKILAYSTVSQLGFMFIGCGVGAYWTGMFHVTTHAFFKALLFLGAGAVIHAMAHDQDVRNYGGLSKYLKITFATMLVGFLAIAGFPFLSGFFSKESILGAALSGNQAVIDGVNYGAICGWVGLAVAFLTAAYMTRMMLLTFGGKTERWRTIEPNHDAHGDHHGLDKDHKPHEVGATMWVPLAVLAVLSAVGGLVLNGKFEEWLYPQGLAVLPKVAEHASNLQMYSMIVAFGGMAFGAAIYWRGLPASQGWDETKWSSIRLAQRDQFGFDSLTTDLSVTGGAELSKFLDSTVEHTVTSGRALASATSGAGGVMKFLQTGFVRWYAMVMLIGVVAFIGYFALAIHGGAN